MRQLGRAQGWEQEAGPCGVLALEESLLGIGGAGSCSRDSVNSQPAFFPISISDVLGDGQGSFLWWVGAAPATGDSCGREGRSQPGAGGNLGSSLILLWLRGHGPVPSSPQVFISLSGKRVHYSLPAQIITALCKGRSLCQAQVGLFIQNPV